MKKIKFLLVLPVVALFFSLTVSPVFAAEFLAGSSDNGNLTVASTETHHNLYAAGGNVTVSGNTSGDLHLVGGNIVIEGSVENDLNVAGGNVTINNQIGGDIRVGAGTVAITGPVNGDVLIGAGTVTVSEKSSIGGDLIVGAGTVTLNAPVNGSVKVSGGTVTINNKISGKVWVEASQQLTFGPKAEVAGEIYFTGSKQAVVENGAQVGAISFTETPGPKNEFGKAFAGILTIGFLVKIIAMILAGLVLVKLFKRRVTVIAENMRQQPWKNLGIGVLAIILISIAVALLFIVIIGYYLAFILLLWFMLLITCSCLVAAIFLGAWIVKLLTKKANLVLDWQAVVIGSVIFSLLEFIPIVGWLIMAILGAMAMGAFMYFAKMQLKQESAGVEIK